MKHHSKVQEDPCWVKRRLTLAKTLSQPVVLDAPEDRQRPTLSRRWQVAQASIEFLRRVPVVLFM